MIDVLFVYGTLKPGFENAEILDIIGGAYRKGYILGIYYPDGWKKDFPYPGVDLREAQEEINGYVFTSSELYKHWGRLDAFEGSNYERVVTTVYMEDRSSMSAYVYKINWMAR